jgi:hypothetical protein
MMKNKISTMMFITALLMPTIANAATCEEVGIVGGIICELGCGVASVIYPGVAIPVCASILVGDFCSEVANGSCEGVSLFLETLDEINDYLIPTVGEDPCSGYRPGDGICFYSDYRIFDETNTECIHADPDCCVEYSCPGENSFCSIDDSWTNGGTPPGECTTCDYHWVPQSDHHHECPIEVDICGNGVLDDFPNEFCDTWDYGGFDCSNYGFQHGTLNCTNDCQNLTTEHCYNDPDPTAVCGNGVKEGLEQCDGSDIPVSCESLGFSAGGTLTCKDACILDTSTCYQCINGECCSSQGSFQPSDTPISSSPEIEYGCPEGELPGDGVFYRQRQRVCSGSSENWEGEVGEWSDWMAFTACAANETCNPGSPTCVTTCECSGGVCCTDGCYFNIHGQSCDTWTEQRCSGTAPGSNVEEAHCTKVCSGGSASCSGSISCGSYSVYDNCSIDEYCYASGTSASCTSCPGNYSWSPISRACNSDYCLKITGITSTTVSFEISKPVGEFGGWSLYWEAFKNTTIKVGETAYGCSFYDGYTMILGTIPTANLNLVEGVPVSLKVRISVGPTTCGGTVLWSGAVSIDYTCQ